MTIFISNKALERQKRDPFIKNNLQLYLKEVMMLVYSEGKRQTEKIGKFNISPRGHKKIRIAWHKKGNDIYIDDFLYHETESDYVDKWNKKVLNGKIKIEDYEKEGYVELQLNAFINEKNKIDVEKYITTYIGSI